MGCTTGTASKWRVRYARARLAGLDETGHRGAAPKYGAAEQKRILAMLDQPPPRLDKSVSREIGSSSEGVRNAFSLGRVDGFDQDQPASKSGEGAVAVGSLVAA